MASNHANRWQQVWYPVADLRDLKRCIDNDTWPNIDPVVREIGVPGWYAKGGTS